MSLKHKKVSGQANTDINKVGGADWDDGHLYGPGSLFIGGRFSAFFNTISLEKTFSDTLYYFQKDAVGDYSLFANSSAMPVVPGAQVNFRFQLCVFPTPLPSGWVVDTEPDEIGTLRIIFTYNGNLSDPTFYWRLEGVVIAEVL